MAAEGVLKRFPYEYDETQTYNGHELFLKYQNRFPLLTIVVQGDYGKTVFDDFSNDQVYRIHTYTRQRRVVIRESRVKQDPLTCSFTSYPVDTFYKFCVMKNRNEWTEPMAMRDILNEFSSFPIMVKFSPNCKMVKINDAFDRTEKIQAMLIITEYEENFFTGNCLDNGVIDPGVTLAALSPHIRYAEITGIKGKSPETFHKHLQTLERFLESNDVTFDTCAGNPDATRMSENGTGTGNPVPGMLTTIIPELKKEPPPKLPMRNQPRNPNKERPLPEVPKIHDKPRAVVSPTFVGKKQLSPTWQSDSPGGATSQPNSSDGEYTYLHIDELKKERTTNSVSVRSIRQSSVSQVCQYLRLLGLDEYVGLFKEGLIDGQILVELTADHLADFKMSRLEIVKLMKFIKSGHIPR